MGFVRYIFDKTGLKSHDAFFKKLKEAYADSLIAPEPEGGTVMDMDEDKTVIFQFGYRWGERAPEYDFTCKEARITDFLRNHVLTIDMAVLNNPKGQRRIAAAVAPYPDRTLELNTELDKKISAADVVFKDFINHGTEKPETLADFFKDQYEVELPPDISAFVSTVSSDAYVTVVKDRPEENYIINDLKPKFIYFCGAFSKDYGNWVMARMKELYEDGIKDFMTEDDKGTFCAVVMEYGLMSKALSYKEKGILTGKAVCAFQKGFLCFRAEQDGISHRETNGVEAHRATGSYPGFL